MRLGSRTLIAAEHPDMIGIRNECSTDRHQPVTFNPMLDATWCRCGLVIRAGNKVPAPTAAENAAADALWVASHDVNGRRVKVVSS
ncbi:hypothetical protein [Rhodococcoides fascians]|uniref:hypothetical protein n=1 Tax=Rhodococcoides fascians TaxID=1828 RepID=UPI0005677FD7|nr:hypothetical protein [Rhodococcus fascians]